MKTKQLVKFAAAVVAADVDLNRFNTVAICSAGLRSVVGTAKLEAF